MAEEISLRNDAVTLLKKRQKELAAQLGLEKVSYSDTVIDLFKNQKGR